MTSSHTRHSFLYLHQMVMLGSRNLGQFPVDASRYKAAGRTSTAKLMT